MLKILPASLPEDLVHVRRLFREYADGLGVDLCFQGFEEELQTLPGRYAEPSGRLLLAWVDGHAVGCVALRAINGSDCEMKRLYVRPGARGGRVGRELAERVCRAAHDAGYSRICLDTLPTMAAARTLYRSLGFEPIGPYVFNPIEGVLFLAKDLG